MNLRNLAIVRKIFHRWSRASPPLTCATMPEETYRIARNGLLTRGLWTLWLVREVQGELRFDGWAIPPRDLPMKLRFRVNGVDGLVLKQPADPAVETVARRYGLLGDSTRYAFRCVVPKDQLSEAGDLRVEFRPGSGRELSPYQDWYLRLTPGLQADKERRVRTAGTEDAILFESMGLTDCLTMRRALNEYFERDYTDCQAILDWGCGCARVARFVAELAPGKLTGIDIDPDNIQWCKEKIAQAEFAQIGLHPPTQLASESFDLVYGISVFTHLAETDQDRWLAELHRITKPGAAVLMSIQGEIAFLRADGDFERFLALQKTGVHIYGRCPDLDDVLPEVKESGYYKNVFHSRRYVYEHWRRHFEILDVIDGAFAGYQDLVVMRRR
jgi:ubiquinone/menaquinone biosynthesis C-methylase UbiE